jgi:branched-chain amino acid transport system substrate-binding protein
MRYFPSALIACIISFTFSAFAYSEPPTVKIGMIASLSGGMAFFGKGWTSAAQLGLSDVKNSKYRYELTIEDDTSSAARAVTAFKKLSQIDRVSVVFSASANTALALAPLARQANVMHLGVSSDSSFADGAVNFNFWPGPGVPAGKLLGEFKRRGLRKIALVGLEHAWPRAVFSEISKRAQSEGIEITMREFFEPGERNFKPILGRLSKSGSDIAVLLSWPPELELFGRQYKELQVKIPLTCDWSFDATSEPALFNGFWFVSFPLSQNHYRDRFKERFGYSPYAQMELGDVMIRAVVAAYEAAGDGKAIPSQEELSATLLKVTDPTTVFGPLRFDPSGVVEMPYSIKRVVDGTVVMAEEN